MRSEDMLDVLYAVREYLEAREDVRADDPSQGNQAMLLKRDLNEVIRELGGE